MLDQTDTWVVVRFHDFAMVLGSTRLMDEYTATREARRLQLTENENYRGQESLRWYYKAVRLEM